MLSNSGAYQNNFVLFSRSIEDDNTTSLFQTVGVNPYAYHQQVGFHAEGFTMPSTNMNFPYQQQSLTNHFPPNVPTNLNGYGTFNKRYLPNTE